MKISACFSRLYTATDVYQLTVPRPYQKEVIGLTHEGPLAGQLGINKTCTVQLASKFKARAGQNAYLLRFFARHDELHISYVQSFYIIIVIQ